MKKFLIIFFILGIILIPSRSRKYIFIYYINLTRELPDKCWLHRTNTVEKMLEISDKYKGIEIDVNFNNSDLYFDVTHDLEDSINLSLEKYFKYFSENDKKIWIDFKNLTENNVENSLNVFENLIKKYNLSKERFIIESGNFEMLKSFKEKGYYTSYYVPYLKLEKMSSKETEEWKRKIKDIILTGNVSAISFPGYMYPFVKSIDTDIDLLTWEDGKKWQQLYKKKINIEMLKDKQLKVILVKEKGKYHR